MAFQRGPNIVTNGLVLALDAGNPKSYVSGSTVWYDRSGYNNSGSLVNGPTFSNNSIVFDGTNDYIISNYIQPAQDTTTSFTWNIWFRALRNSNSDVLLGYRGSTLSFTKLTTNGWEYYPDNMTVVAPLNIWQNVCLVKNTGSIFYYRNAELIISRATSLIKPAYPFYIGGDPIGGEISNAIISNVQVYNKALSAQEVLQNYNALKSRFEL